MMTTIGALAATCLLLSTSCCQCYTIPRTPSISMAAGKRKSAVSTRRDVLNGDSLTKQFYDPEGWRKNLPPGWSPVLVVSLGAAAAKLGGSGRTKLFDEVNQLSGGDTNQGAESHLPIVTLMPGRASGKVSVIITAPASADAIDYMWAVDADSGEIFSARKFAPRATPKLELIVDRGRRFVPSLHCVGDGVWQGAPVVAT